VKSNGKCTALAYHQVIVLIDQARLVEANVQAIAAFTNTVGSPQGASKWAFSSTASG
jgi:hypothetical protein